MHALSMFTVLLLAPGSMDQQQQPPAAPVQLVSPLKAARLRALLPQVADPAVQQMLDDPALILYTDKEMPRAFQLWAGELQGVHSPNYNISANGSEPFGNGNREFPWGDPAGTHRTKNVTTFRFLWLPRDADGRQYPVVWYRKRLRGDSTVGYAWTFPVGAVVGEVLVIKGPDGHGYTFEIRTRTRESGSWGVDVFRPFPSAGDLARRIKQLRPAWQSDEKLAAVCRYLEEPVQLTQHTLADRQPARRVFQQQAGIDSLPPLGDDSLVIELLSDTTFQSALGTPWRVDSKGLKAFAPTTQAAFHIVPAHYDAGFVEVDRESCIRCHETVNQPVDHFNFSRDWYGRIRGSDGIFSFHPFSLASISSNGYGSQVRMRAELVEGGALAEFHPDVHPHDVYQTIEHLVE